MISIMEFDEKYIELIPNITQLIYDYYGTNCVSLYLVSDSKSIEFVVSDGENCLYIDKDGYRVFKIDEDGMLKFYRNDRGDIFYKDNCMTIVDKDKNESSIKVEYGVNSECSEELVDVINYERYNSLNDVFVQIVYEKRHNDIKYLYDTGLREPESFYIIENFTRSKEFNCGFIPSNIKAFNKLEYDYDMLGYELVKLKENGILGMDDYEGNKLVRYIKSYYLGKDGYYKDFGFLSRMYRIEEIEEILRGYGFNDTINSKDIDLYNKNDWYLYKIREFLECLKKENGKDKKIELTLQV